METIEITLQYRRGETWPVVVERTRAGELPTRGEGLFALPPGDELVALDLDARAYGTRLGDALFQGPIRDALTSGRASGGSEGVRILLVVEDPGLKPLRWERLCAPDGRGGWDFLALDVQTPFSRYLPSLTERRYPAIGRRDLRALVLLAAPPADNPYALAPFDAAAMAPGIAAALDAIPCDLLGPLPGALGPASLDTLVEHLGAGTYTLLHLVAHGWVRADGETALYLLDSAGLVAPVTAGAFIERLGHLGGARGLPHLVFLAACEGAKPQTESALGGLAQRLVRELGVPAVVAMTDRVSIATATDLATRFYGRLRALGEPDLALVQARVGLAGRVDGLVPALFNRLAGRPLFCDRLAPGRILTPAELAFGLARLESLIPERAPILSENYQRQAAILRVTLEADPAGLAPAALQERQAAQDGLDALCQEVLDQSFPALALDQPLPVWDGRCPFPGLKAFGGAERVFYFGREREVRDLRERLARHRLLAVLGASGSGKSSLVLAGLAAPFAAAGALRYLTPGAAPETALGHVLAAPLPADADTLLVVDQLEELFTLCHEREARERFAARLIAIWQETPRLSVCLTLRADFWGDCAAYPALKDLLQEHQELIAPMDTAALRTAMEQQAAAVGLRFEADLSHRILAEVEDEPGAMPLLQHLLLELWRRRHGRWLRASEYRALGGIRQAIAYTADGIYRDLHDDPGAQGLLRGLCVRLTRLDAVGGTAEPTRDTRQRVALGDLIPVATDPARVRALVQRLADARLVVTSAAPPGETLVEVSHEALIRHWPRLRTWLDEDRASWILLASLAQQARDWQASGERGEDLPRWSERLAQAEVLFGQERFAPTAAQRRFLDAARALAARERAEREAEQRERLAALERAATEQRRKARIAWLGAGVTAVLMGLAVVLAYQARQSAREASYQTANLFWAAGGGARVLARDPLKAASFFSRAVGLLAAAGRVGEADSARLALKLILDRPLVQAAMNLPGMAGEALFSPDGQRILAWGGDGTVQLWDSRTGEPIGVPGRHAGPVRYARFSPDGTRILTASADGTARLWDGRTGAALAPPLRHEKPVRDVRFSPDGTRVLSASEDGTARLWDTASGAASGAPLRHRGVVRGARFDADGRRVLTWSRDGSARLWDGHSGAPLTPPLPHGQAVWGALLSTDGTRVMTGSRDGTMRLWDAHSGAPIGEPEQLAGVVGIEPNPDRSAIAIWTNRRTVELRDVRTNTLLAPALAHDAAVRGARFSSDGARLLTWDRDGKVWMWDARTAAPLGVPLASQGSVAGAEFSGDATRIVTWSGNGSITLWDPQTGAPIALPLRHLGLIRGARFAADGRRVLAWGRNGEIWLLDPQAIEVHALALRHAGPVAGARVDGEGGRVLSWGADGTVRLWDSGTGVPLLPPLQQEGAVIDARLSPDGSRILAWGADGTARLWDSRTGTPAGPPLQHAQRVAGGDFDRNGQRVLTWSDDGTARVWDVGTATSVIPALVHEGAVAGARFSPDGERILTWGDDGTARLWDAQTGTPAVPPLTHAAPVMGTAPKVDWSAVLTWSLDGTAALWDTRTGTPLIPPLVHRSRLLGARFDAAELRILTWSEDGTARLWDSLTGAPLAPPLTHDQAVIGATFSPDERLVLTWSDDGSARLWDSRTGEPAVPALLHDAIQGAVFDAQGERVLTWGQDHTARLWNVRTGEARIPALRHDKSVLGAGLSASGSFLLTWGEDGTVRLWDSRTGDPLGAPLRHDGPVVGARFERDDSRVLSWSADGTVRLWDIAIDRDWPAEQLALRTEVETGSTLIRFSEPKTLAAVDWQRKRWCDYDTIRHDLGRLSADEWAQAQRLCRRAREGWQAAPAPVVPDLPDLPKQ